MVDRETVVYLCNAVTDSLKKQRALRGDSPAATKKVMDSCRALAITGVDVTALSMGRGRVHGPAFFDGYNHSSMGSYSLVAAAYLNVRLLTYIVSVFSLAWCLYRVKAGNKRVLFVYNRLWLYLPALLVGRLLGYKCVLDLEDDNTASGTGSAELQVKILNSLYSYLCRSGTVVINSKLERELQADHRTLLYYGSAGTQELKNDKFLSEPYTVLLSGSLMQETGVQLLIDAVILIEEKYPQLAKKMRFIVTGDGPMAADIAALEKQCLSVDMSYKGLVSFQEYQSAVQRADVGLCLKQANNIMGQTTFPSKVIEYVGNSLLLISTRVSDVEKLFASTNVRFLNDESAENLVELLAEAINDVHSSRQAITRAHAELFAQFSEEAAGKKLGDFLMGRI